MRKLFVNIKGILLALLLVGANQSCTDLTEEIYSDVTPDNFFNTDEEFASALGEGYLRLRLWVHHNRHVSLQEVTTDAMVVPTRGTDWNDGGSLRRLHRHEWHFEATRVDKTWNFLFQGVSAANRLIWQFEQLGTEGEIENLDNYIAELRGLRALFYYQLLDLFGNVPIVSKFDVPADYAPATADRADVYDFLETELLEIQDLVSKDVGGNMYGRVNYYTVQAILAKLYLNAEVYTGTPQWEKALAANNAIINSGEFSLTNDYYENFVTENQGSPEFIFAIPYDATFLPGFIYHRITLHYRSQDTYNLTIQPWNGFTAMEEFYKSYIDPAQNPGPQGIVWGTKPTSTDIGLEQVEGTQDLRLANFLVGPQFSANGQQLVDPAADADDPNGQPLTFTPYINELGPQAWRQSGARIGKWEFAHGTRGDLDNDFAVYRYADILLMKAEALFRMGGSSGEALELVNRIRRRAGVDDFTVLTEENLLAERGRELFAELHRRTDLIRFGRFNDAWWEKDADPSDHVNIFPIPRRQLDSNPNLKQNPGY